MKIITRALLLLTAISLVGCGSASSDLEYLDSRVVRDLELPPDLTQVDINTDFDLPAVFSGDSSDPESRQKIPVLAKVDSLKLEGFADFYWLSLEAPVDQLYQLVKDFWASEGFTLALDEPVIGLMETEWVFDKQGKEPENQGFFISLFSSGTLSSSQDKFRTRISLDGGIQEARIYISHRGTELVHGIVKKQNKEYFDTNWNFSQSNTELEVEMLSRLMIYLGLRRAEVEQQLENIKLFESRASFNTDYENGETYLLVQEGYSRTWYRTLHQLDRLNIEVVNAKYSDGFIGNKGLIRVNTDVEIEVKDSGFFSIFTDKTEMVKMQVVLNLSEESHDTTRISIETAGDEVDNVAARVEFLELLYQYIK